jgi:nucleotide-binding universal stress UspA family protein
MTPKYIHLAIPACHCVGTVKESAMFARILVAIDTSVSDKHVFDTALSLAQLTQARLLLAHILPHLDNTKSSDFHRFADPEPNLTQPNNISLSANPREEVHSLEMLRRFHSIAKACGVGADIAQPLANPGDKICNLAIDWGADLIVMGRREPAELEVSIQSSVSNFVVCNAPCPVLITQHNELNCATELNHSPMVMSL